MGEHDRGAPRVTRAPCGPALETRSLTRRFGRRVVLDGIDLTVARGSVVGYLGPNGAGKTTTMRIALGLLRPSSGEVRLLGGGRPSQGATRARVGYLPGDFVAYPSMTATDYLSYLARLRPPFDARTTTTLCERLRLDPDRRIGTLSHGNRQKVGIVQAMMHAPDLLVLDEPTAGLDPLVQHEFLALLREARDRGAGVLLSSHVMSEVEAVADTVAIIRDGRLVAVDDVARLLATAGRRLELTFTDAVPLDALRTAQGVRHVDVTGRTASVEVTGSTADLLRRAAPHGIERLRTHEPDLAEVFASFYPPTGECR
ncbi:ABC transporter ATP-binding protein [Nocardioides sp. AX2bis]|uniref:ABC transporter ATP-binding protein n=1 Tax=Nocardioides sp. AX2bis TaxID=2653157 RepID=UPI0012F210F2|nr:ABC transporter ATP-binding protein [Nocardioides sp. AX2bis]VXC46807.1 ABC-2 type transport system ATP-binding protein [Nocardioides sp. AX2bis]